MRLTEFDCISNNKSNNIWAKDWSFRRVYRNEKRIVCLSSKSYQSYLSHKLNSIIERQGNQQNWIEFSNIKQNFLLLNIFFFCFLNLSF